MSFIFLRFGHWKIILSRMFSGTIGEVVLSLVTLSVSGCLLIIDFGFYGLCFILCSVIWTIFPSISKYAFDIQVIPGKLFSVIKYTQFNNLYVAHHCSMIKEKEGQETACGQNKILLFY